MSIGTKYIEEDCKKLFPNADITRIDTDSVTRENILEKMSESSNSERKAALKKESELITEGLIEYESI